LINSPPQKSNPSLENCVEAIGDSALKPAMAKMNAFHEELKHAGVMRLLRFARQPCGAVGDQAFAAAHAAPGWLLAAR